MRILSLYPLVPLQKINFFFFAFSGKFFAKTSRVVNTQLNLWTEKSEILILTQFLRNIAVFSPQERKLDWFPICKQRFG